MQWVWVFVSLYPPSLPFWTSSLLGSSSSSLTPSLLGLELSALLEEGATLQDLVQTETRPEASLQLPLPSFPPFLPSLSFPSSLPPTRAGVPGGGTCQSLTVPLRLPAQGAAPPKSQVVRSLETPPAPVEAVGLRTLQTPLRPHGEYIYEGLGGASPKWGQEKQGPGGKTGTRTRRK